MLNAFKTLMIFCLLLQAQSLIRSGNQCWKRETVKIIDDCDILKDHIPVQVGRLQSQDNCLKNVVLEIGDNITHDMSEWAMRQEKVFLITEISTKERCTSTKVSLSADSIEGEKYMMTFLLNSHHCEKEKDDVDFWDLCHDIVTTTPTTTIATTKTTTMTDRQLSEDDGSMIRVPVWLVVAVTGNKSCCFFVMIISTRWAPPYNSGPGRPHLYQE